MFNFLTLLRRFIFVWSVFYLEAGSIQIIILITINMVVIVYIAHVKPFIFRVNNRIEIFNEIITQIISCHTIVFTEWVTDYYTQEVMSWCMIFFITFYCIFNIMLFMGETVKQYRLTYIQKQRQIKAKIEKIKKDEELRVYRQKLVWKNI